MKKIFLGSLVLANIIFAGNIEDSFKESQNEDTLNEIVILSVIEADKTIVFGKKVIKELSLKKEDIESMEKNATYRRVVVIDTYIEHDKKTIKNLTNLYKEGKVNKEDYIKYKKKYQNHLNMLKENLKSIKGE